MTIDINGTRFKYDSSKVWDCLQNITKAVRPQYIYEFIGTMVNALKWDRDYDFLEDQDLCSISTELSELASLEVWL